MNGSSLTTAPRLLMWRLPPDSFRIRKLLSPSCRAARCQYGGDIDFAPIIIASSHALKDNVAAAKRFLMKAPVSAIVWVRQSVITLGKPDTPY
jgi:hypothetical protein